ncbi:MAG: GNAT family N-acetyltransferase [Endomicrobiaceae bacterium]|nr:GNAT family N-acetyltransferase [Endomicrobiaceae bacterium]
MPNKNNIAEHTMIKAKISDLDYIVDLHIKYIGDSFFTYLGRKFLKIIYSELILSKYASTYLYAVDNKTIGYISFVLNKKIIFIKILFTRCLSIIFCLNFKTFLKCIFYCFNSMGYILKKQYCKSELLFIAVDDTYRNNRIASKLIDLAEIVMRQNNIFKVQVSINDDNFVSQNLVKDNKYIFYKLFNFYGKKMRMYYKLL